MAKIIGILLFVGAIWLGIEVATKGPDGAFDGALASAMGREPVVQSEDRRVGQRSGSSVDRAHRESEERWKRLLDE